MAQTSRPWPGTTVGDAGTYDQEQWAAAWEAITNSVFANEGVVRQTSANYNADELRVEDDSPVSADVIVQPGRAFVAGIYYENDAAVTFTVPANGTGSTRSDLIVIRATWGATQTARLAYKTGTTALTQTFGTTYEIPIAQVDAPNGFATISQTDIIDRREWCAQDAAIVRMENRDISASAVITGNVIAWRTGFTNLAGTLSQSNDPASVRLAGIALGNAPNAGDEFSVVTMGLCRVLVNTSVSAGDFLGIDTVLRGYASATNFYKRFGVALESGSAGDSVLAFVNFNLANQWRHGIYRQVAASGTNGGGLTAATWTKRDLNSTIVQADPSSIIRLGGGSILLVAGTYKVKWFATAYAVNGHQTRLRDITNGVTLLNGSTAYAPAGTMTTSIGDGIVTVTGTITAELQHNCNLTNAASGQGLAATTGEFETYVIIDVEKISS